MNKKNLPFVALMLGGAVAVQAGETNVAPVIVTATRTARTVDETLASVTVISREDIETSQATNVPELLSGVAGIDVATNGGYGKTSYVYLRGTNSSHVLVLVDGVQMGSATSGSTAFEYLPIDQIERIEIVRGPRSSLYGSEAIGGVIQIFTRKGKGPLRTQATAGFGTYGTHELSAGLSGGRDGTTFNVYASHLATDGINARDGKNPDNDGYDNSALSLSLGHAFSKDTRMELSLLRAGGNNEYDGYVATSRYENDFVQQAGSARLHTALTPDWQMSLSAGQSLDESDYYTDGTFTSRYNTRRSHLDWQNDLSLGEQQLLTLGVDRQFDKVDSTVDYQEISRGNTGVFLQHQWFGEQNELLFGLRRDENEAFGGYSTGNIAWGRSLGNGLRLTASYGTAFKAPTFNQLYWPGAGNPDLKPEKSKSAELGLRGPHAHGTWSLSAYRTRIENLISGWPPVNVNKAEIAGLEMGLNIRAAGWKSNLSLSLTDPRDADTDKVLARRAKQTLRLDLDRDFGDWGAGATVLTQGERYDDAANNTRLPGYGLLNLRLEYRRSKEWVVRAKVDNVFNREYRTINGYNNPGAVLFVSASYQGG